MIQSNITSWETNGDVGILSISNGKENYLTEPDFLDIDLFKKWISDEKIKGLIIRGLGRNFSAGADVENLKKLAEDKTNLSGKMNKGKEILNFIEDLTIPVVASINGVCFGGGLEIALACHMRIASERALFAFPETNHGLIPGLGGNYRLTQLLGKRAYEFILTADMVCAAEAKKLGFVEYISETKDTFDFAMQKMISMVSDRSLEIIQSAMKAINNSNNSNREEALKLETELFCNLAVNVKFHQKE
jgi:enoyl-CoA hydratase/carnithine racemase